MKDWGNPNAESAERGDQSDHHMGWGLWLLSELVRMTKSTLWIWTGNGSYTLREDGSEQIETTTIKWPGVLIDVTMYPERARQVDFAPLSTKLKQLGEDLGL